MSAQKHEKHEIAFETADDETVSRVPSTTIDTPAMVDARNRWYDDGEFGEELEAEVQRRSAHVLYELFLYCTEKGEIDTLLGLVRFLIRALMFVWVFAPALLVSKDGKPVSLEDMAVPLKRTRCWLSMEAEAISNKFKFFSRNQKSRASRPNYAAGALKGWEKRWKNKELLPIIPESTRRKKPTT